MGLATERPCWLELSPPRTESLWVQTGPPARGRGHVGSMGMGLHPLQRLDLGGGLQGSGLPGSCSSSSLALKQLWVERPHSGRDRA